MVHHIRDHIKQKIFCDKCGVQFYESQQESHDCNVKEHINDQARVQDKQTGFLKYLLFYNSIIVCFCGQ